jgi:uncharacterized damage-inducible protein DinB
MEPNCGDTCRQHLAFMKWADDLMLATVAEHTPGDIAILQHIYLGEEVWFRRVQGDREIQITQLEAPSDIGGLANSWPALHRRWTDWADSVTDWGVLIPHCNSRGTEFNMPAWQIVRHLVNHGSYHRGQVAAALRAAGVAPPATDLIVFYRTHEMR